jgi:hypothetical protein
MRHVLESERRRAAKKPAGAGQFWRQIRGLWVWPIGWVPVKVLEMCNFRTKRTLVIETSPIPALTQA